MTKAQIKNCILVLAIVPLLTYCGTKKNIEAGTVNASLSAKHIIKNHYKNKLDFKTIRGRIKIDYDDGVSSKGFTMSFRMEKDKAIWLSAPLNIAKAFITPDKLSFYSKLDNTYFDGDFSYVNHLLGTELDFEKLQNVLLGQAIFDLTSDAYKSKVVNNTYQLKPEKDIVLFKKMFLVDPTHFKMILQQLSQPEKQRRLNINYKSYQNITDKVLPDEVLIIAEEGEDKTTIELSYKNMEFDQKLSFPYRIPKGYKKIIVE